MNNNFKVSDFSLLIAAHDANLDAFKFNLPYDVCSV